MGAWDYKVCFDLIFALSDMIELPSAHLYLCFMVSRMGLAF